MIAEQTLGQLGRVTSILILLALALLFGASSLAYPETALDMPTSMYIARTILEGGAPYRDAWEARGPGIYFAYAVPMLVLGKGFMAVRVFDLLWQLCTALTLYAIAMRADGRRWAGLLAGGCYLLLYYSQSFWSWAEPDGLLSLPLALAFLFVLKGLVEQRVLPWGLAGTCVALAALFKWPFGLFGIAMLWVVLTREQRQSRTHLPRLAAMTLGFAAPLFFCGLYFYLKGALGDLLFTQFVFVPRYVARVHQMYGLREFLGSALRPYLIPLYLMSGIGLGSVLISVARRKKVSLPEKILCVWIGVAVLTFLMHGSYLAYHYLPLIAPLVILAVNPVHSLYAGFSEKGRFTQALLLGFAALFFFMPGKREGEHAAFAWRTLRHEQPIGVWPQLGSYIRGRTLPEEKILVWGNAPDVYLHAERKAASRFLCTAYLSLSSREVNYRGIFLQEFEKNKPIYFVLVKIDSITPGLPASLESFRQFEELKSQVTAGYQLEQENNLYVLFRRKETGPVAMPRSSRPSSTNTLDANLPDRPPRGHAEAGSTPPGG